MPLRNIYTYETVDQLLNGKRMVRIANNTYAAVPTTGEPRIDITLHLSHIVTLRPDATVEVHIPKEQSERTRVTKDRINRFLPDQFSLFSRGDEWWMQDDLLDQQWILQPGLTYYFDWTT